MLSKWRSTATILLLPFLSFRGTVAIPEVHPDGPGSNSSTTTTTTTNDTVYVLQATGRPDNLTKLELSDLDQAFGSPGEESLSNFTLCMWYEIRHLTETLTFLSYAADGNDNFISLGFEHYGTFFFFAYASTSTLVPVSLEPLRWQHWCLVGQEAGTGVGHLTLYLNGNAEGHCPAPLPLPLNGTLVLGRDQHRGEVSGSFPSAQSFVGRVSETWLWPRALPEEEVGALARRRSSLPEPEPAQWVVYGDVRTSRTTLGLQSDEEKLLIPIGLENATRAEGLCQMLNMTLARPESKEENYLYAGILNNNTAAAACTSSPHTTKGIGWLGLQYNESSQSHREEETSRFTTLISARIVRWEAMVSNLRLMDSGEWLLIPGGLSCPLCSGQIAGRLYLLGFCEGDGDGPTTHVMIFYPRLGRDGVLYFLSLGGITIALRNEWTMSHEPTNTTMATTSAPNPIGLHNWTVHDGRDLCQASPRQPGAAGGTNVRLSLSNCSKDEFTCNDGACVPMEARCSSVYACEDKSDEADCELVLIKDDYSKGKSPSIPLKIQFVIEVQKVSSVNILARSMQVNTEIKLSWYDERLVFTNLLSDDVLNVIEDFKERLWLPQITVTSEQRLQGTVEPLMQLTVIRKGLPKRVGSDYHYSGTDNPILYTLMDQMYISCSFNMIDFPFDEQVCWLNLTICNVVSDVVLTGELDSWGAAEGLSEYVIIRTDLKTQSKTISVVLRLRRRPTFDVFANYLPVLLLHAISYGTLFIDPQDFQDRGTMSLTSLLVLISLYSDTMTSLPRTSYLKLLDIWFIFSIAFLSVIIAVHLATNSVIASTAVGLFYSVPREQKLNSRVLRVAQVVLAIIYCIFQIFYWGYVALL